MKEYYKKAGIPAVECYKIGSREGCFSFAAKYGYPIVVKPDNGVGAQNTYRISNDQELDQFFAETDREGYLKQNRMWMARSVPMMRLSIAREMFFLNLEM